MTSLDARSAILDDFLHWVDAGLPGTDSDAAERRSGARRAWIDLMTEDRPRLEAGPGLDWPYAALAERASVLESAARSASGPDRAIRRRARLTLGLLPFPGGWRWTRRIVRDMADDPEVRAFVDDENRRIRAKIAGKDQKIFKLRHFCQILKAPRPDGEKGVLRIFSLPYAFADRSLLEALGREYMLFVEPPWGVLARHAWLRVFCDPVSPVLFGLAGAEDRKFVAGQPGLAATKWCHGDFLEEEPVPPPTEPEFDLVFNATFDDMPRKRHDFFLSLLADPRLRNVAALCVGRGDPDRVGEFRAMVAERGLADRVSVRANLPRREIPALLARCRAGVLISLHENGPRAIYECLRSNLPVVLSACTAGVDFEAFREPAGRVASDAGLPEAIRDVLERSPAPPRVGGFASTGAVRRSGGKGGDRLRPAEAFRRRTGSERASRRLNDALRDLAESRGLPWSEDIVPLGSGGASRYTDPADFERFRCRFEALRRLFRECGMPIRLGSE